MGRSNQEGNLILIDMDCFEFHPGDYDPGNENQQTQVHLVFDIKQDLRWMARLVCKGHLVNVLDNMTYSLIVKGISIKLFYIISHQQGLDVLVGDVGNAYMNVYTNEKVWV